MILEILGSYIDCYPLLKIGAAVSILSGNGLVIDIKNGNVIIEISSHLFNKHKETVAQSSNFCKILGETYKRKLKIG